MNATARRHKAERPEARTSARSAMGIGTLAMLTGAAHLLFIAGPPLLAEPISFFPSLRAGDILDLVTPLVVIPLVGLLFLAASPQRPSRLAMVGFAIVAVVWVEGQAIHLAANAIGHHVPTEESVLSELVGYMDEELSHQMWHGAVVAVAAMTMYRSVRAPAASVPVRTAVAVTLGGSLFGLTFFLMVVEGQTAGAALPAAAAMALAGLGGVRARIFARPALAFYLIGLIVALGLALVWAAFNAWRLVEFSEVFGF